MPRDHCFHKPFILEEQLASKYFCFYLKNFKQHTLKDAS